MKKITVQIDKNGKSEVVTSGFLGSDCKEATKDLEKRLGKPVSDEPTEEMYYMTTNTQQEFMKQ